MKQYNNITALYSRLSVGYEGRDGGESSIDVYTHVGYFLQIDCNQAEHGLKTTPCSECALNALEIEKPYKGELDVKNGKGKHSPDESGQVRKYLWNGKNNSIIGAISPAIEERQGTICTSVTNRSGIHW